MTQITGVIQEIIKKQTSAGEMADIVVAGTKYGAGKTQFLRAKEGDYVQFDLDESRGYKNVARNSLKVSKNKPPAEAVAQAAATSYAGKGGFDARQDAISRQAASNTAIAWLALLQQAGAITVPATQAKSKGGSMAYMDTLRTQYEKEFYENNTGNEWKSIAPNAKNEDSPDVAEDEAPEDDEWN